MTDEQLVAKKLAFIETCVAQLRQLARPELIATDIKEERFAEHTLQIAIQAAMDVALHITADDRLGEPTSNRELFDLLHHAGWLDAKQLSALHKMAGFRNVIVHGYTAIDVVIVRDVVENHLSDLIDFCGAVRARMTAPRG